MPRSSVVLSREPVDAAAVARAAGEVRQRFADPGAADFEVRPLDDGAALQVVAEGVVVLTVLRPRGIPAPAEQARVLPGEPAPDGAAWWAEAYTPWTPEGVIGVEILETIAGATAGRVVHQGIGASARGQGPA
jgi:hypothetical protein